MRTNIFTEYLQSIVKFTNVYNDHTVRVHYHCTRWKTKYKLVISLMRITGTTDIRSMA